MKMYETHFVEARDTEEKDKVQLKHSIDWQLLIITFLAFNESHFCVSTSFIQRPFYVLSQIPKIGSFSIMSLRSSPHPCHRYFFFVFSRFLSFKDWNPVYNHPHPRAASQITRKRERVCLVWQKPQSVRTKGDARGYSLKPRLMIIIVAQTGGSRKSCI